MERSLRFYLDVLGPLGAEEAYRYKTYRGTEDVVYLRLGSQFLGVRPADGGEHRHYGVGIEHFAVFVDKEVRYLDIHEDDQLDEAQLAGWVKQASQVPGWGKAGGKTT